MGIIDVAIIGAVGCLLFALGFIQGKRSAERACDDMANRVVTLAIRDREKAERLARRSQ